MHHALEHRPRERRGSRARLAFALLALALAACGSTRDRPRTPRTSSSVARPPNVVLIVADDLGWGDLGSYGQAKIRTPNLDALASRGVRFTRHYAGGTTCAASRCALLTGKHTAHAAIRGEIDLQPQGQMPLPAGTETLASVLQRRGYETAAIGTWGLGANGSSGAPGEQGFEAFFGEPCARRAENHFPPQLWRNGERVALLGNDPQSSAGRQYAADLELEEALAFLRRPRERPFFLYLSASLPHLALQTPSDALIEYVGRFPEMPYDGSQGFLAHATPRAAYASMVSRLDEHVGRIVATLAELGLTRDTLVVFTSDDGPPSGVGGFDPIFFRSADGFRGSKGDVDEGGLLVPLLAVWPGRIAPLQVRELPTASWDLLPTIAELAGADAPADVDGVSLAPTLLRNGEQTAAEYLYWESFERGGAQAVRIGNWKGVRRNAKTSPSGPLELYDLRVDPGEQRDVAAEHADVVSRMAEIMQRRSRSSVAAWNF